MSVKFSVITISLNAGDTIKKTCESICSQTFRDFEWIVIDGQSTDGTLEFLDYYSEEISILISERDSGIYNAMNKGIAHASGDYCVFMNAGDSFYDENTLSHVAKYADSELLYGDVVLKSEGPVLSCKNEKIIKYPEHLTGNFFLKNTLSHQSSFYKRNLFEEYGGYDQAFKIAGDYEMFVRLLKKHNISSRYIARPLSLYFLGGISNDLKFRSLRKREYHQIRWKYFPQYRFSFKSIRQEIRNFVNRNNKL